MSQHKSFKVGGAGALQKKSVLKRFERVDLLRKRGQWKEGDRVVGLRKPNPRTKPISDTFKQLSHLRVAFFV